MGSDFCSYVVIDDLKPKIENDVFANFNSQTDSDIFSKRAANEYLYAVPWCSQTHQSTQRFLLNLNATCYNFRPLQSFT